jgi:Zn-dependent protease with chaperone function
MADSLSVASLVTLGLILIIFSLFVAILINFMPILLRIEISLGVSLILLLIGLVIAPLLMDQLLERLYGLQWENLAAIRQYSEESAEVVLQVCREKSVKFPRLGRINTPVPFAFSYGSWGSLSRIVVSQGLMDYLDDEEIAAVYAYEMGLILQWNKALMTLITLPSCLLHYLASYWTKPRQQPIYLSWFFRVLEVITVYLAQVLAYPLVYLARTRNYHADHLASEITGNPNGLIRALAKSAYGLVKEQGKVGFPRGLEMGIRPLNLYDPQNAVITGTAYRQQSASQRIGQVFLWDLYNPWSGWLELTSTHSLTGRRISVLALYAEQMELDTEFSMSSVLKERNKLNQSQFMVNFALDCVAIALPFLGIALGIKFQSFYEGISLLKGIFWGFGVGTILQVPLIYPFSSKKLQVSDIFSLMADPYASPIRGRPVTLSGKLLGDLSTKTAFTPDLKLQDPTGIVITHYTTRLGDLSGLKTLESFVNIPVRAIGWFYRGVMPSLDLSRLDNAQDHLYSYHRFRALFLGSLAIIVGLFI